ncbi:uncharacterized protein EAF02_008597 [Botrytis sinoallii]|uniref:uncharacterized protein n=1 Tax=Botrytis sinoallii TaxID=1463999 RepID=UPI00190052BF|nr:uncharacterized protein EAF02_008597 [Botrytis sinoallii]KAF7874620.1 hypothetical protein EAF02_008597 [Botrytis sinoallii]
MAPTIVLISGANRGLEKGLLAQYMSKPDHIVIAANRDPSHPTSKALSELPTGANSKLDLVIANAGVSYAWPSIVDLKIEDLEGHFIPSVYRAVRLYQATLSLLLKSENPKYVTIGSTAGTITRRGPLNAFVLDPGWYQTELGNSGAVYFGMDQAAVSVEDSCALMVPLITKSTKESHGGKFWSYKGGQLEW